MGLCLAHVEAYYFFYDYLMWDYFLYDLFHDHLFLYDYFFLNNHLTIDIDYFLNRNSLLYHFLNDFFFFENDFCGDFERKEDFLNHYHLLLHLDGNLYYYFFLRVPLERIFALLHSLGNRRVPVPDVSCALLLSQAFFALNGFFLDMRKICKS